MREEFQMIDEDGDGEMSLLEFKQVLTRKAGGTGALGPLSEDQIDDLFNELRLKKSNESIRWHEFIAASLSQCNFDERNMRLAFDRLDYDRTGYITFQDVKDLFGSSQHESDDMFQMWQDGMTEYACPLGRITYDDFRKILKGRGRELEQPALMKRQSLKKVTEGTPLLLPVPEGSLSPQVKHATFSKFDDAPPSLKMPSLDPYPENDTTPEIPVSILPSVDINKTGPSHRRTRSGSLGSEPMRRLMPQSLIIDTDEEESGEFTMRSCKSLDSTRSLDAPPSPKRGSWSDDLLARGGSTAETFRQHNDFRLSVLKASRTFEAKVLARKLQIAASNQSHQAMGNSRASLIMRRGARPEMMQMDISEKRSGSAASAEKEVTATEVRDACRRGGRARGHRRKRTTSDISGMLK
jgi:Ca2+-binding EF-hand superfamily protein